MRISDNGVGFDAAGRARSSEGHLGLTSMRERAEMASGWLHLRSDAGGGTTVEFWLPAETIEERQAV